MDRATAWGAEDQDALRRGPSDAVKAWLLDALRAYGRDPHRLAFRPFDTFIGRDDMLAADIAGIYHTVPAENQRAWRGAVADLVAELPLAPDNAGIFDHLLDIARILPAYEVFSRAANRFRSADMARLVARNGQSLFERVLLTAIDLAAETDTMRDLIIELASSGAFDPAYAGVTLVALCRTDPGGWADHLDRMRPRLAQMQAIEGLSESAMARHATGLIDAVGLDRVIENLNRIRKAPEGASVDEKRRHDDWLFDALLLAPDPIVLIDEATTPDHPILIHEARAHGIAHVLPPQQLETVIVAVRQTRAHRLPQVFRRRPPEGVDEPEDVFGEVAMQDLSEDLKERGLLVAVG